ncbi:SGNH/GDSL hydrolase family protein [Paenibacillus sp. HB172176]|uniref:SGNH/GDSL hydrolase family protein n=1 Tax=Paenibacillus sp. HB172176 TaxID=2493690 RepID=UPI00143ADD82|nr:SGNH/GDSL hydrolase family protein [Paenibacillus sp. HB172176]
MSPRRFTNKQMAVYAQQDNYRLRSHCSSSVELKLLTDSDELEIVAAFNVAARDYAYLDCYVNERRLPIQGVDTFGGEQSVKVRIQMQLPNNNGLNSVRIVLPHNVETVLHEVRIKEGASVEPVPGVGEKRKLLCLGDSITQGMDAHCGSHSYPTLVAETLGLDVLNQGIGGYVFDPDSLDEELAARYPADLITVAYGTNDWARGTEADSFEQTVSDYFAKLVAIYPKADIYAITPIWRKFGHESRAMGTLEDARSIISKAASRYPSVRVIDGLSLMPAEERLFADGTHPTDDGFMHYALKLARELLR